MIALPDTVLVGRADDLQRIGARAEGHRLVTLLGPAGVGKTRLSLHLAATWAEDRGAASFCDLSSLTRADDVRAAIAESAARLDGELRPLLVCDNLEHVAEPGARAVAEALAANPDLTVVATSRERLGLPGEWVESLEPLAVPDGETTPSAAIAAVALFLDRARHLDPTLDARVADDPTLLEDIGAVVRRLDGIPLAIELAAARIAVLSPRQIRDRLDQRFQLLRSADRFAVPRQATLEGAIAWSWALLDAAEQTAFVQLAVFRGGFTLDAAEAVLALPADAPLALDVVQGLRDKSLLRPERDVLEAGEASVDPTRAPRRLGTYESLGAWGVRHLDAAPERGAVIARHTAWALAAGEAALAALDGPAGARSRATLAREADNLSAVLDRALAGDGVSLEEAVRAALALEPVWLGRGGGRSRLAALAEAVAEPGATGALERAQVWRVLGNVERTRGALAEAVTGLRRARAAMPDDAPAGERARLLNDLGIACYEAGEGEPATAAWREALGALDTELPGGGRLRARILGSLAVAEHEAGAVAEAEAHYREALTAFRALGDQRSEAVFATNLADLLRETDRLDAARGMLEDALRLTRALGEQRVEGVVLGNIGGICQDLGHLDDAERYRRLAVERLEEVDDKRLAAVFDGYLGAVFHLRREIATACAHYQRASDRLEALGDRRHAAIFAMYLGGAQRLADDPAAADAFARAARLLKGHPEPALDLALRIHAGADPDRDLPDAIALHDEVRFALRVAGEAPADVTELVCIEAAGTRVRTPDGTVHDLRRRKAPRHILRALAALRQRSERDHDGLDVDALFGIGWPGEVAHPDSVSNRVYVAVATLRDLGLRDVLVHRDGYLLEPGRTRIVDALDG